jgi:hypothetical protein
MLDLGFGSSGPIFVLLFAVAVVALAVWVLSKLFPKSPGPSQSTVEHSDFSGSPPEMLRQPYERGEIPGAHYEVMRHHLDV